LARRTTDVPTMILSLDFGASTRAAPVHGGQTLGMLRASWASGA
jgi:hypothetical protein